MTPPVNVMGLPLLEVSSNRPQRSEVKVKRLVKQMGVDQLPLRGMRFPSEGSVVIVRLTNDIGSGRSELTEVLTGGLNATTQRRR